MFDVSYHKLNEIRISQPADRIKTRLASSRVHTSAKAADPTKVLKQIPDETCPESRGMT